MKYTYKNNNLDMLRLILASSVVFLHLAFLAKTELTQSISNNLLWLSGNAVSTFFIVSGFLIYMSYDKRKSFKNYAWSRFLRLYPAYILIVIACAVILTLPIFYNTSDSKFNSAFNYFIYNSVFLNFIAPSIDGVFESNPESIINGSLWTLKIEVMFYASIPFLYYILEKKYAVLSILLIYILSFMYKDILLAYSEVKPMAETLSNQLPGQMMYFISGVFCYKFYGIIKQHSRYVFILTVVLFFIDFYYLQPLCIALLITVTFVLLPNFLSFSKLGDLSYGIYIFHFPIIQVMLACGFVFNSYFSIIILLVIIFSFSLASWKLIEAPSLKFKNKFI